MKATNIISQLRYHAGWNDNFKSEVQSLSEVTWKKISIEKSVNDILLAFEILNVEVNGNTPSEIIGEEETQFSRSLLSAISEILRLLEEEKSDHKIGKAAAKAKKRIERAWGAVLDGDIDNIIEYVTSEEYARDEHLHE